MDAARHAQMVAASQAAAAARTANAMTPAQKKAKRRAAYAKQRQLLENQRVQQERQRASAVPASGASACSGAAAAVGEKRQRAREQQLLQAHPSTEEQPSEEEQLSEGEEQAEFAFDEMTAAWLARSGMGMEKLSQIQLAFDNAASSDLEGSEEYPAATYTAYEIARLRAMVSNARVMLENAKADLLKGPVPVRAWKRECVAHCEAELSACVSRLEHAQRNRSDDDADGAGSDHDTTTNTRLK